MVQGVRITDCKKKNLEPSYLLETPSVGRMSQHRPCELVLVCHLQSEPQARSGMEITASMMWKRSRSTLGIQRCVVIPTFPSFVRISNRRSLPDWYQTTDVPRLTLHPGIHTSCFNLFQAVFSLLVCPCKRHEFSSYTESFHLGLQASSFDFSG